MTPLFLPKRISYDEFLPLDTEYVLMIRHCPGAKVCASLARVRMDEVWPENWTEHEA